MKGLGGGVRSDGHKTFCISSMMKYVPIICSQIKELLMLLCIVKINHRHLFSSIDDYCERGHSVFDDSFGQSMAYMTMLMYARASASFLLDEVR